MVSLPLLGLLWSVLRQLVEKAEERFKRWTKPAPGTLLEGVAADLLRTKPELVAENALPAPTTHRLGTAGETSGPHVV